MSLKRLFAAAAVIIAAASCTQEIQIEIAESQSYDVTFNLAEPSTKTFVTINGSTASYSWNEDESFEVLRYAEDGANKTFACASSVAFAKQEEKARLTASYSTAAPAGATYAAVYPKAAYVSGTNMSSVNLSIPAVQNGVEGSYDPGADLLISRVTSASVDNSLLQFKRLAAVGRVNVKGLSGCEINSVSITFAGSKLAGTMPVNLANGTYSAPATASSTITVNYETPLTAVSAGTPVFFTCLPNTVASGSQYTIEVTTSKGVYTKQGTLSAAFSFAEGDVLSFGVSNFSGPVAVNLRQVKTALAAGTKSSPVSFKLKLEKAVVTYVNGNNAFLEDETCGLLYYKSSHDFVAGDILSGNLEGEGYAYYGVPEITNISSMCSKTSGTAPEPELVSMSQIIADFDAYESRYISLLGVTVGAAINSSNRNSTITVGDKSFPIFAKVSAETDIAAGAYGNLKCIPCYYTKDAVTENQIGVWGNSQFTVLTPVSSVSLNKTSLTLVVGNQETLSETVLPADASNKNVTWASSNKAVATVANGVVTAVAAGTATITVTTMDGNHTATCDVTVSSAPSTETFVFRKFTSAAQVDTSVANFSVQLKKGESTGTKPAWNATMNEARIYASSYLTISSTYTISKIEYSYTINKGSNGTAPTISSVAGDGAAPGTWTEDTKTWTGSANTVTLTTEGTAGNVGFTSFTIYYSGSSSGSQGGGSTPVTPPAPAVPTWLTSYEFPAYEVAEVTSSNTLYNGYYCHSTVTEKYGTTEAAIYNTPSEDQKIVVHTFEYNSKVQSNFSMLFDKNKKCALWVCYQHSAAEYPKLNDTRTNAWSYDPALPQSWQPNLSSSYPTYNGMSFDRGHQVASNDRQTTAEQNKQTFYYSNMTPQFGALNQQKWRLMEEKFQGFATNTTGTDKLFVVTGPLFEGVIEYCTDKSGAQCALPTGYFKCAIRCSFDAEGNMTSASGCAYIVETNSANTAPALKSIDYVESKTGFDFFANVPDALENAAEAMTTSL